MSRSGTRFDYVIVGAGSAGCVLANRLSENSSNSVLLIEAGPRDGSVTMRMPAALGLPLTGRTYNWGFVSEPEPGLDGRVSDQHRGRVLGGSSSINGMVFVRGNPLDFEAWAELGLPTWSYAHCLPYFRRMETFEGGGNAYRGDDGPLHVHRCRAANPLYDAFLGAGQDFGLPLSSDPNGRQQEGVNVAQATTWRGERDSSARAFLRPARGRANLSVITGALVRRVAVAGNRATGVVYAAGGVEHTAEAEAEVILSAGAFGSPQLLMLSGIGDAAALAALGVGLHTHLPGVGGNLQDHVAVPIQYTARRQVSPNRQLSRSGQLVVGAQWLLARRGLGTSNYFEVGAFFRGDDRVAYPNIQHEFFPMIGEFYRGEARVRNGFQYFTSIMRPASRGSVTLRSADPAAAPVLRFNYLSVEDDMTQLLDGVRKTREIIRQKSWDELRGDPDAALPDMADDAAMRAWVRSVAGTGYHAVGTCRMGTDAGAVTDEQGRVHGIGGLRVVDASLMPRLVTGNTNAATIMIAEKLADAILGRSMAPLDVEFPGRGRSAAVT